MSVDEEAKTTPRIVRVLVVEDNPHVAELVTRGLEGAARRDLGGRVAFVFETVCDGQQALARVEESQPELIICDVYMPVMDGAAFLRRVRARPDGPRIPVLALSAGGESARDAAMAAGADAYLDKPVLLQNVVEEVARLLELL